MNAYLKEKDEEERRSEGQKERTEELFFIFISFIFASLFSISFLLIRIVFINLFFTTFQGESSKQLNILIRLPIREDNTYGFIQKLLLYLKFLLKN